MASAGDGEFRAPHELGEALCLEMKNHGLSAKQIDRLQTI